MDPRTFSPNDGTSNGVARQEIFEQWRNRVDLKYFHHEKNANYVKQWMC